MEIKQIATIRNNFKDKFGIPRQSGIDENSESVIIFEPEFRDDNALRGLDGFSHLWLIWHFSMSPRKKWSPTVRPPRLGGNTRMGVFATRSPNRPNPIGLSCVKLIGIEKTREYGTVLHVSGADLMDSTPIFDIKPYLSYTDSHPNAVCGFADDVKGYSLKVNFANTQTTLLSKEELESLTKLLENDPRPSYQHNPQRVYKMTYGRFTVSFTVCENTLTVCSISNS